MPPRAEGQVQKAFQGEKQAVGLLRRLFDACVGWASNVFGKLTVVKLLLPGAELVFSFRRAKNSARRRGVLETFKNVAEKRGVHWRASAAEFEARGLDVWESERAAATDPTVVLPRYYEKHGVVCSTPARGHAPQCSADGRVCVRRVRAVPSTGHAALVRSRQQLLGSGL
jgi:hypothetical protein